MFNLAHETLRLGANETPDSVAIRTPDESISYRELDELSNQVFNFLILNETEINDCIGIFIGKRIESIVCLLGILKTGASYVPLETGASLQRNAHVLNECSISILFATVDQLNPLLELTRNVSHQIKIVLMDACDPLDGKLHGHHLMFHQNDITGLPKHKTSRRLIRRQDTAVVFYTSGSTGAPKGVMISHESIVTFVKWAINRFQIGENDKLSSHAPLHFDISLLDIFAAFAARACVVLIPSLKSANPNFICQYINRERIAVWQSVPSILILMVECGGLSKFCFNHVKHIIFTGEKMPPHHLAKLMKHFKNADFHNVYGCTETNDTFIYTINRKANEIPDTIPIGQPLPYVAYKIIGADSKTIEGIGEGELLVNTPTVMSGYKRPSAKKDPWVELKYPDGLTTSFYRTGDVVRRLEDGNLELCCRLDSMIKIDGHRVNLLDVQNGLQSHPEIMEAAVFTVEDQKYRPRIVAVAAKQKGSKIEAWNLKLHCSRLLARQAIPSIIQLSDQTLPKTSSGKMNLQSIKHTFIEKHSNYSPGK